jgi:hypothetical protein
MNMQAVPKTKKKISNKMERAWGNSSEETFLTARIRLYKVFMKIGSW